MIYTELTKIAIKIAFKAHKEQSDKAGLPYIHHPLHLAEQMTDEISTCVALLHDVVEDSSITYSDLVNAGFSPDIITSLQLLEHKKSVSYMDYVNNIANSNNLIAIKVKLADLKHNSDITRLNNIDSSAEERLEKYKKAIKILTDKLQ